MWHRDCNWPISNQKNTAMPNRTLSFILIICWTVSAFSAAADPFVGKWKVNASLSRIADQMSIEDVGNNKYRLTFGGTGETETVAADGTDQPGLSGSMLSVTIEQPDAWKIVRKKEGRILLTAKWKLSKDGKTLTDAFTSNRPDGSTSTINMMYTRAAGNSGIPGTWETTDVKLDAVYELEIRPYQSDGLSFISNAAPPRNIRFDGQEHLDPATGASLGAASLGHRINERSLEYTNKVKDKVVQTRQLTVSPDLKTLTIVLHLADQRLPNTLVFDRE
jgi:hypothetical protein